MSNPRHLWSGDWERDSSAAREELAKRRARLDEPAETPPAASSPRARPSPAARVLAWLRAGGEPLRRLAARERAARARARTQARARTRAQIDISRQLRIALVVAVLALLSAGAAYGVTTLLVGSSDSSASASAGQGWIGFSVTGTPLGIVLVDVVPGSPAAKAGLQVGDFITRMGKQPIGTVDAVTAALAGRHPGQWIDIHYARGLASYTTQARLAAAPPGYP